MEQNNKSLGWDKILNLSKNDAIKYIKTVDTLIHISEIEHRKYQRYSKKNILLQYWPSQYKLKNPKIAKNKTFSNSLTIGFIGSNNPINGRALQNILKNESRWQQLRFEPRCLKRVRTDQ